MAPLNLFRKEIQCGLCGSKLRKSHSFGFDSTIRGKRRDGEKTKLCKSCFLDKMRQSIQSFEEKAVFYYPTKNHNAYHYYKFKDEFIEEIENEDSDIFPPPKSYKFIPKNDEQCMCCNGIAKFSLCKSKAFEEIDTYTVSHIPNDLVKVEYLCAECLISKLTEVIERENIILNEYFPPVDKEGIAISGDY